MSVNDSHHFLWPYLVAYHQFKEGLGFTSFRNMSRANDMDEFTVFKYLGSLDQLDDRFVHGWIHMMGDHRSAATKNRMLCYARGFFEYLVRQDLIKDNPTRLMLYLKCRKYKPHIYSLYEIHQILEEAAKHEGALGRTLPMLFLLLYACGLRISEALKLKIRDVDFEQNTLALWDTKFHKERLVPFSATLATKLKNYLAFRQKTFPHSNPRSAFFRHVKSPLSYGSVVHCFHDIIHRCGLTAPGARSPRLHDFRHSFACHRLYKWYQEGYDTQNKIPILSIYMGHISVANTQVYLSATQDLMREASRRFQTAFEDVTNKSLRRVLKPL